MRAEMVLRARVMLFLPDHHTTLYRGFVVVRVVASADVFRPDHPRRMTLPASSKPLRAEMVLRAP
jgi:hypothetical protein